jgi:hypothetical protein
MIIKFSEKQYSRIQLISRALGLTRIQIICTSLNLLYKVVVADLNGWQLVLKKEEEIKEIKWKNN